MKVEALNVKGQVGTYAREHLSHMMLSDVVTKPLPKPIPGDREPQVQEAKASPHDA